MSYTLGLKVTDVSKMQDEKLGRPHKSQLHDTLCNPWYTKVFIPKQLSWYHLSQESQQTPVDFHVMVFWQDPHGYLGVLGPVFGSGAYEFASNIIAGYKSTSLPGFNLNLHISW